MVPRHVAQAQFQLLANYMMSKKGLSDIVTNVLIILLVLVAVGIIWLFLRPTVNSVGQVQGADECFTLNVEPVSCILTASGGGQFLASITLKRNPGEGTIDSLKAIFTTAAGVSTVQTIPGPINLQELGTGSFSVVGASPGTLSIAPVVKSSDGTKVCPQSLKTVTCA